MPSTHSRNSHRIGMLLLPGFNSIAALCGFTRAELPHTLWYHANSRPHRRPDTISIPQFHRSRGLSLSRLTDHEFGTGLIAVSQSISESQPHFCWICELWGSARFCKYWILWTKSSIDISGWLPQQSGVGHNNSKYKNIWNHVKYG